MERNLDVSRMWVKCYLIGVYCCQPEYFLVLSLVNLYWVSLNIFESVWLCLFLYFCICGLKMIGLFHCMSTVMLYVCLCTILLLNVQLAFNKSICFCNPQEMPNNWQIGYLWWRFVYIRRYTRDAHIRESCACMWKREREIVGEHSFLRQV